MDKVNCFVLFLALVVAGCAPLVQNPAVILKRTSLVGMDASGADLEFFLGVTNPNSFDVSLFGYSYDLQVVALPLVSGSRREDLLFATGKETELRLPVRLKYADLLELLKRRPDPDRVPYRLKANLQIRTLLGEMVVPVDKTGMFALPEKYHPAKYLERLKERLWPLSP